MWAWLEGVRFDGSSLGWFWQYVDPALLKAHLAQSLWYLHAQPPGYNLLLGVGLKLFGDDLDTAAFAAQVTLGLALAVALYAVLVAVGVGRWFAAAAALLFTISPATILFENWLFYEYVVAALLVFAAVAFVVFVRHPDARRAFVVFLLLASVCYVRASFQLAVLVLVLAFMLFVFRGHRRAILLGAAAPVLLVVALMVKNWVLFGTPTTSSWTGMNLMQIAQPKIHGEEENSLQRRGLISPVSTIPAFSKLSDYAGVVPPDRRFTDIPVLSEVTKPSGTTNYNNIDYVRISNQYLHDFVRVATHDPSVYLSGVWFGLKTAVYPSPDYNFFLENRAKMEWWVRGYDAVVLVQPHEHVRDGQPVGTAWGLIVYYVAALLLGAAEMVRILRRRGGSPTVAFAWLRLVYATVVMTFGEIEENQRIRFVTDPLALVLVCVLITRLGPHAGLVRAWQAHRRGSKRSSLDKQWYRDIS